MGFFEGIDKLSRNLDVNLMISLLAVSYVK